VVIAAIAVARGGGGRGGRGGRRLGGLAVLVAAAALALAACSGSPTTAQPKGNPPQLLDEWAACMRDHGDPGQADPTIDAYSDINITIPTGPDEQALSERVHGGGGPCSQYLSAASLALSGGQPPPTDNPAQDVKFAECMRANGVPNYPDPVGGETKFNGTGVDPNSPIVQNTTKVCDEKIGIPYNNGNPPPGDITVTGCQAPAGLVCPDSGSDANG
jgi:hypothetical protein